MVVDEWGRHLAFLLLMTGAAILGVLGFALDEIGLAGPAGIAMIFCVAWTVAALAYWGPAARSIRWCVDGWIKLVRQVTKSV